MQTQALRRQLLEEKRQLLAQIDLFDQEMQEAMRESIQELSFYDNHPADMGSELFEREKDFTLRDTAKTRVIEIDKALARMDAGTYGFCVSCGAPIPEERLQALPEVAQCISCKKKEETPGSTLQERKEERMRPMFEKLLPDNDAAKRYGKSVDSPNIYDDWDSELNGVEEIENYNVTKGKDGMYYAKKPQPPSVQ